MKYLLKQNKDDKGILCDKVTINGFDYYVSNKLRVERNDFYYDYHGNIWQWTYEFQKENKLSNSIADTHPKVIATNNPNIDIPKVIDDVERLSQEYTNKRNYLAEEAKGFYDGYNNAKERYPFSEEDMFEFAEWMRDFEFTEEFNLYEKEELLKIWEEQRDKIVLLQVNNKR